MPDVRTRAVGATTVGANYEKFAINTSDAGRELVVKVSANAGILHTELLAIYRALTLSAGTPGYATPDLNGPDAFTSAAIGTATGVGIKNLAGAVVTNDGNDTPVTVVFLRAQGTGTVDLAALKAAAEAADVNATTFTVTLEAVFQPAK
jgi:hypothetical protein